MLHVYFYDWIPFPWIGYMHNCHFFFLALLFYWAQWIVFWTGFILFRMSTNTNTFHFNQHARRYLCHLLYTRIKLIPFQHHKRTKKHQYKLRTAIHLLPENSVESCGILYEKKKWEIRWRNFVIGSTVQAGAWTERHFIRLSSQC